MEVEEIIKLHSEALERKVEADPFRPGRVKARLRENLRPARLPLGRTVLLYGLLVVVFTFVNFMVISGLKEKKVLPSRVSAYSVETIDSLQATYPGSISHAYEEVMK
jgi:hypothetical protein